MSENTTSGPSVPNANRLLWAGFMAIFAAGIGFAIRGGILDNWKEAFNFNDQELGSITGAGLSGFCFGIIIGGLIVDKIGYGKLVILAFLGHILSAFVTFAAGTGVGTPYDMLFWGSFIFAYANGTLEAVANPLVATIFPQNRTHYLNILHASWPAGLVVGSALGWLLDDQLKWAWQYQLALYLVPTAIYAIMFFGQYFPKSEAAAAGTSFAEMYKSVGILGSLVACYLLSLFLGDILKGLIPGYANMIGYAIGGALVIAAGVLTNFSIGSWILFVLFVAHALVGSVELGTDSWIQNITGNLFSSEQGKYLFLWTSAIMFGLRFCAHWIESNLKIKPMMLLFLSAVIACIGLNLASTMQSFGMALVALGIYAVGKTFFWPTMLAVVGDRYPKSGAVAMSIMGGIGMLSAGLIGGPGLGYCKDRFAGLELMRIDSTVAEQYKAETPSRFLNIEKTSTYGLNGKAVEEARKVKPAERNDIQTKLVAASEQGDRTTLRVDSFIPATMAVIYLLLMLYFQSIGGYRPLRIDEEA